uniref:Uncharacterized protein n=1 Tax=Mus spicilegus TaxID=10103 RepID=A0A8C6HEV5_MUSSI
MGIIHRYQTGDQDELQGPEAHVGHGEELIIADVGAAWLLGIADEILLIVVPHLLCRHHIHQHPEDEDHRQPDAAQCRGVLVHTTQDSLEKSPVHAVRWLWGLDEGKKGQGRQALSGCQIHCIFPEPSMGRALGWECPL